MHPHGAFLAELEAVLRDPRLRLAEGRRGRLVAELAAQFIDELDIDAVKAATLRAGSNVERRRRAARDEIARQLVEARIVTRRDSTDDSDKLLGVVAGGATAILIGGPQLEQPIVGMVASVVVASMLTWGLWRRWARRRES